MGTEHQRISDLREKLWSAGNYAALARVYEPAAEHLVQECEIGPGHQVLDVGAGTGNAALLAARTGACVVASDITANMVRAGRSRSRVNKLSLGWLQADAESLPHQDAVFDATISVFGSMYAPHPHAVAAESFRVTKRGGCVGMANWTPQGYAGHLSDRLSRHVAAPPGLARPIEWGSEDAVRERFAAFSNDVRFAYGAVLWRFGSMASCVRFYECNAGPIIIAKETWPPERYEQMITDLVDVTYRHNTAGDDEIAVQSEYMLAIARRE